MFSRLALCLVLATPLTAEARPQAYLLDAAQSSVQFEVAFGPDRITGSFPVTAADVTLDFENPSGSKVSAVLDAAAAEASFPFATQALRGPKVLDVREYPEISFQSSAMRFKGTTAEVEGLMTIRGVTHPEILKAELYRQKGTAPGDLDHLSVLLTGTVARSDFGATGWSDMVSDQISMKILVRIDRAD
ncbi:MAG: hypothetical protein RLZZ528_138 [Pseudomonadota bacterium]|jgi:polyisoprenoid-binding protein YceI